VKTFTSFRLIKLSISYALLFTFFSSFASGANAAEAIYVFLVTKLRSISGVDEQLYEALSQEFAFVGITFNQKPLRQGGDALYIVSPQTPVTLSAPNQNNVFFLKSFDEQSLYSGNPGIDVSPKLDKVKEILGAVFNGNFKLGFISEGDTGQGALDSAQFFSARFEEGRDPFKAVNRLINYNRIDVLLLSDNITDRTIRRKIFISCLEQNRFAIGTKTTDVEDGALASIYYDDSDVISAAVQSGRQYQAKRSFNIALLQPQMKIKVNKSLAKARNIPSMAFHFDSAETTYE